MSKEFENTLLIGSVFQGIQTGAHQINEDLNSEKGSGRKRVGPPKSSF